ncbi:MAG: twin-arginine translocation signal domain-containing protein [Anaerolineales bacterium]|nr:twin-arginine translocation signal domain-containing protein [Anaerolineales bacterium]
MSIERRTLLKLLTAGAAGGVIGSLKAAVPDVATTSSDTTRQYEGANLSGWEVTLGDSLYNCSGALAVTLADIETVHQNTYSELKANIAPRKIRAHNITFKRFVDDTALNFVHIGGYKFRLPYLPQPDIGTELNGQTIEGGLFVWDGVMEVLDKGIAFQWVVNPWNPGSINTWDGTGWVEVGTLALDTAWHEVMLVVDYQHELTALKLDGTPIPTLFSRTAKGGWDSNIAARLQAEIISVDIEDACNMQAMHQAEFKDWYWEPARSCQTYLPMIRN